jgi:hypothetical protein
MQTTWRTAKGAAEDEDVGGGEAGGDGFTLQSFNLTVVETD